MNFLVGAHTDVGIRKKTNQDAVLVKVADTDYGRVTLAVICDGMGGLRKGELASAVLIRSFSDWFHDEFPDLLYGGFDARDIRRSWERQVSICMKDLERYSEQNNVKLGTTLVALLLAGDSYYIMNIGDSRVYEITDTIWQMTRDQTFVQREMDAGRMTAEEAKVDPRRNVLLQCVGASDFIEPEYLTGKVDPGAVYLLCSDGFRHVISPKKILERLNPHNLNSETAIQEQLVYLTELNKFRRESDNISAAVIRVLQ